MAASRSQKWKLQLCPKRGREHLAQPLFGLRSWTEELMFYLKSSTLYYNGRWTDATIFPFAWWNGAFKYYADGYACSTPSPNFSTSVCVLRTKPQKTCPQPNKILCKKKKNEVMNFIFSQLVSINTHFPRPHTRQIHSETPLTRTACNLHVRKGKTCQNSTRSRFGGAAKRRSWPG